MRATRLASIAFQSEILLLRRYFGSLTRRAIHGAVAALFALAALALVHVEGFLALVQSAGLTGLASAAIVLAVDLVVAAVFGILAAGAMKDPVAEGARQLRDQSIAELRSGFTAAAMFQPAASLLARRRIYSALVAALTARFVRRRA